MPRQSIEGRFIAAQIGGKKWHHPAEYIGGVTRLIGVDNTLQGDLIACAAKIVHGLLHHEHRCRGVLGTRNGQVGRSDIFGRRIVVAKRGKQSLSRIGHVADGGFDARVLHGRCCGETRNTVGEVRTQQPRHRRTTHAAADTTDARSVDARAEIRIGEHQIDDGFDTERSQRLQLGNAIEIENDIGKIAEVHDLEARKTTVTMKRCGDDVAEAGQPHQKIDRLAVYRTTRQPVREHHHRPASATGWSRKDRDARLVCEDCGLAGTLHVRDTLAIGQKIIGTNVACIRRVTRDHDKIDD